MRKVRYVDLEERMLNEYSDDVERIVKAFAAYDMEISPTDARQAWRDYSDSMCAGWLSMKDYKDEDIVASLNSYLTNDD